MACCSGNRHLSDAVRLKMVMGLLPLVKDAAVREELELARTMLCDDVSPSTKATYLLEKKEATVCWRGLYVCVAN